MLNPVMRRPWQGFTFGGIMTLSLKKYIGDRAFYKMLFLISIPIMLQNALTSIVGLLDNVMVGQLGTNDMTGVSVANNLLFVYLIVCFGSVSGAGIFSAQYFGKKDFKGMASAFRMKIYIFLVVTILSIGIFLLFGKDLISLYMHDTGDGIGDVALASKAAWDYLFVMLFGLPFLGLSMCYSSTMRESGSTFPPMIMGIISVLTDLVFNYLLIFGNWGFPKLGVTGAAVATVLARVVECILNMIYTHINARRFEYINYAFKTLKIPRELLGGILVKGLPLVVNEALWVISIALGTQCFSTRGLVAIAAININSSIANVFNVFFLAMGSAVSIIIGPLLGANKIEEAKDKTGKLVFSTFFISLFSACLMAMCSSAFPNIYETEPEVKALAVKIILIAACIMPFQGVCHSGYFALRSGGKTWLTFLFDSGLQWACYLPLAFFLSHYTDLSILKIFAIASMSDVLKCFISILFLKKVNWAQNIVEGKK